MGVIRRNLEPAPIRIEESEDFGYAAAHYLPDSDTESMQSVCVMPAVSRSQRKKVCRESRRLRRFHDSLETDGVNMRKHMGSRKWRRVENARMLLAMTDKEDIVDDFSDMLERTMTAFDELFSDTAKMAAWNSFIEMDEDAQRKVIRGKKQGPEALKEEDKEEEENDGGWFVVGGRSPCGKFAKGGLEEGAGDGSTRDDKRHHHPAYAASSCFERCDVRIRRFLSEKHLPWAVIDRSERDLRSFFLTRGEGAIWGRVIDGAKDRLAVHAVAQFLMLTSKSCTDSATNRRVLEVRNARAYFIPPRSALIPYLATRRRTPIEFVPRLSWQEGEKLVGGPSAGDGDDDGEESEENGSLEIIEEEEVDEEITPGGV